MVFQVPWQTYTQQKGGWDHDIYCRAAAALEAGKDPYITANLGIDLSYPYPALFLKVYKPLCGENPKIYIWAHWLALVIAAWVLIKKLRWDRMITLAWLFLGYNAANANYHTGNVGAFEALFFALFLWSFVKEKPQGSLLLVPASFLKIVPSVMILPALFADRGEVRKKASAVFYFALGLLSLTLLNYFYSENLFFSFWRQALGMNSGQHSPIREVDANPSNPTVLLFLQNLSQKLSYDNWLPFFGLCVVLLGAFSFWVWKKVVAPEKDRLLRLCWMYLLLFLWIPRLKPYSLLIMAMVMIPLVQRLGRRFAILLVLLTIFHRTFNGDKSDPWMDFLANNTMIYVYFISLILLVFKYSKLREEGARE